MVDTITYAKINLVGNAKLVHKSFTKFLNVYAYMYMQSLSEKIVECLKMEILTNISKEGAGNQCFNQAHWLQFHLSVLLRLAIKLINDGVKLKTFLYKSIWKLSLLHRSQIFIRINNNKNKTLKNSFSQQHENNTNKSGKTCWM